MRSPTTHQSHRRFPLTSLLGDSGNLRVLRALLTYGVPQSSTQLAQASGLTRAGVLKVLSGLSSQGAVRVLGAGRTQLFEAIASHPLVADLKGVFEHERAEGEHFVSQLRRTFETDRSVKAAWLYGSVARGEDDLESDVDVAVLVENEAAGERIREALQRLEQPLRAHFSVIALTPQTLPEAKDSWWAQVVRDGRTLKGPDPAHVRPLQRRGSR
jgi:predicted nucleotidyltransferase